jgi:upstream activation factor subunit UAF30
MAGKGLSKKLYLSEEMAEFMGKDKASRTDITKALWDYIKANELNEGRTIHPDDVLAPILGSKSLTMFEMPKRISDHVSDEA